MHLPEVFTNIDEFTNHLYNFHDGSQFSEANDDDFYEVMGCYGDAVDKFVYMDDGGVRHPITFVEQEGGGEGGAEKCHTVLKIGDTFYKFEYRYYSYHGFDHFLGAREVTPRQQVIVVYD